MRVQRRALFLSHGGGPLPLLGDEAHAEMVSCLKAVVSRIPKPSNIVVVSAHWESAVPCVTAAEHPHLLYDYGGFPPEAYAVQYPCLGNLPLAKNIAEALKKAGVGACLDAERGLDHGVFVPLKVMYPDADIPCVQLSLMKSLDSQAHVMLGRALQDLADPSLLLIGSGFSFHNMRAFFAPETAESRLANASFERWLVSTCSDTTISEDERLSRLLVWEQAPAARYCHPREEHLLPLHVCYGFAGAACSEAYTLRIAGKLSSMYLWES